MLYFCLIYCTCPFTLLGLPRTICGTVAGVETGRMYTTETVVGKNVAYVIVSWELMTSRMQRVKAHHGGCGCISLTVRRPLRLHLLAAQSPPLSVLGGMIPGKTSFPEELSKMHLTRVDVACRQPELWSSVCSGAVLASSAQKWPEGLLAVKDSKGMARECMGHLEETVSEEEGDGIQNKVHGGQQET